MKIIYILIIVILSFTVNCAKQQCKKKEKKMLDLMCYRGLGTNLNQDVVILNCLYYTYKINKCNEELF